MASLLLCAGLLLLLAAPVRAVEFTTNTTITSSDYTGQDIIVTGCTLTIDCAGGQGSYNSLLVRSNGVVTHPAVSEQGLWLATAGNVTVQSGSYINASGKGYPADTGPGRGLADGRGGAHGGSGEGNSSAVYDSITLPAQLGSGGGSRSGNPGGAAGGLIRIMVGGTLSINGDVVANGSASTLAGSGSGGAIFLSCGTLAGTGEIYAYGASSNTTGLLDSEAAGGGGGGRIAVSYASSSYTGTREVYGGTGRVLGVAASGGPGTIYTKDTTTGDESLVFDNASRAGWTLHPAFAMENTALTVNSGYVSFDCSLMSLSVKSVSLSGSSRIAHPPGAASGLSIITVANMTIASGSFVWATGCGHAAGTGPGGGVAGSGGAHGGSGQGNAAGVYGSITAPDTLGSGGGPLYTHPGGTAGGMVRLNVGGTLSVVGDIVADGSGATTAGGGAGGSIYATCGTLAGTGEFYARGGTVDTTGVLDSEKAGGGAGGRIAIYYASSSYAGTIEAFGGTGRSLGVSASGGPGTRYVRDTTTGAETLTYDNASRTGWTLQPAFSMPNVDLVLYGARVSMDCSASPVTLKSASLQGSSYLAHPAESAAGLDIVTSGDFAITSGSFVYAVGFGYAPGAGPGAGAAGSGGAHGGSGQGNAAAVYGSIIQPVVLGSGGGALNASPGAAGGGRVTLDVGGTLSVVGDILADGLGATGAGGGAGGSIYATCGAVTGTGELYARGGTVNTTGVLDSEVAGGGAGGRIAVHYASTSYSGTVEAYAGTGKALGVASSGGPGSRYFHNTTTGEASLIFDNASRAGWTLQPAVSMPDTDLTVNSGRVSFDCAAQELSVKTLRLSSSSYISHPAGSANGLDIVTSGGVTIDAGSIIDADGKGHVHGDGAGAGADAGEGAGYGGAGGLNTLTYGARECPNWLGSGGGDTGGGAVLGGAGGGRVTLHVGETLTLGGAIRARGSAAASAGGGSGGSILIVSGGVTGSGDLYVNGGSGTGYGGGGGGRIAGYAPAGQSKLGSGTKTAAGGTGTFAGAAGTIYTGDSITGIDLAFSQDGTSFGWDENGVGTLNAIVVNPGSTDAGGVVVSIYDRNPALPDSILIDSTLTGLVSAHGSQEVTFTVTDMALTEIWVVVDPANAIAEANETNNTLVMDATRVNTQTWSQDRTGTITEVVNLRGYLKRLSDNAMLAGETITFKINGTPVGTAVTNVSGRADLNWTITAGNETRTILVRFAGDDTYNPSQGTATLTAQTWNTKQATFNRTQRIAGRTELKARLLRSDNTPIYNRAIRFSVDGTFVISRLTDVTGYAKYPNYDVPDGAGAGARTITSEWIGSAGYRASTGTATLTVLPALPYIWVLPKTVAFGAKANLYAYFRRLPDYQKQAGKSVDFRVDGTFIASAVTDAGGVARHLYQTVEAVGDHTIRCEFAGDAYVEAGAGEGLLRIY